MSPLDTPCAPRHECPPRLGIFVDCRHFKAKIRPVVRPQAPRLPASSPRPRAGSRWPLVLLLGFTVLLGVSVAAGTVYAFLASSPATVNAVPVAQVVQTKKPVSAASAAKRHIQLAKEAKADPTPPPPPVPAAAKVANQPPVPEPVEPPPILVPLAKNLVQQVMVKEDSVCDTQSCKGSGDFCGTAVTFVPTPKLAAEEAAKQHKLVFVLHVSGNFEDPGFT